MRKERISIGYTCDKIGCTAEMFVTVERDEDSPYPVAPPLAGWFECRQYHARDMHFCPQHAAPYIEYERAMEERNRKHDQLLSKLVDEFNEQFGNDAPVPIFPSL